MGYRSTITQVLGAKNIFCSYQPKNHISDFLNGKGYVIGSCRHRKRENADDFALIDDRSFAGAVCFDNFSQTFSGNFSPIEEISDILVISGLSHQSCCFIRLAVLSIMPTVFLEADAHARVHFEFRKIDVFDEQ